jgi:hypothetical protein
MQQPPPPPPSANAGNGEYVAPLQQQTQQTYVPQSVALSGPGIIKNWNEGDPIPPGYHPQDRMRTGLLVGGLVLFGTLYLFSALGGAIAIDACKGSSNCHGGFLLVPVVGPFIEIANANGSAVAIVFGIIDGVGQAAGVAMAVAGFTWPKTVLIRNDLGKEQVTLQPVVGLQNGFKITF